MQLKKFLFVIALFLVWGESFVKAQDFLVKGRVVDASNGGPVEYANIGVVGTYQGTATDLDGHFDLQLKSVPDNQEISVSAVGYRTRVLRITELQNREKAIVELIPVTYGINEVDIEAPSRILYGMLKVAVRQIPNNYLAMPYSADALYEEVGDGHHRQLNVSYTDAAGYQQRNFTDAFMSRRYLIKSGSRDFETRPFEDGLIRIEELLGFDMLRIPGNVLDTAFMQYFKVSEKERYVAEGQHILVLSFECDKPGFAWTGDALIRAMSGEIHIAQEDLTIKKTVARYESGGRLRAGRSFFSDEKMRDASIEKVEYEVETDYNAVSGKLLLHKVKWKNRVFVKGGTQPVDVAYSLSFKNITPGKTNISTFRRHYYDDVSERR
jgi:hypothetical protein